MLLPALDEGLLIVPRIGEVRAAQGFQVVATQNPVEYIATGHLSEALRDRFEHVGLDYQDEGEEIAIVRRETGCADLAAGRRGGGHDAGHAQRPALSQGRLGAGGDRHGGDRRPHRRPPTRLRRAAGAALPTRVELRDETDAPLPDVLDELVGEARKKA